MLKQIIDLESDQIIFIPMGGSTLQFWVNEDYLGKLNLAQFHLYDSDIGSRREHKYIDSINTINTRDNCIGLETTMREFENYIPMNTLNRFYEPQVLSSIEEWRTCDIPESIAKSVHNLAESRTCDWDEVTDKKKKDKVGRVKNRFNTEYILATTEEDFQGHEFLLDEIIMWHEQIVSLLEA